MCVCMCVCVCVRVKPGGGRAQFLHMYKQNWHTICSPFSVSDFASNMTFAKIHLFSSSIIYVNHRRIDLPTTSRYIFSFVNIPTRSCLLDRTKKLLML